MKVSAEKIDNSQMVIEVEAEPEEVERSLEGAYQRLVQKAEIPGFRKGKAPRHMLERYIGREALLEDALEQLVPQLLSQAINEHEIDVIARPDIEITKTDPVTFKATVPVRPTVELGNYAELRVDQEPSEVSEEDINRVIEQLRHQHATWEPVERPVKLGDLLTLDVKGSVDDKPILDKEGLQFQALKGVPIPVPGFSEGLEGLKKEQRKKFSVTLPEDYGAKELAGKECHFEVMVNEIKEQKLPELDDEFAKSMGQDFDTLGALKDNVTSNLRAIAEETARRKYENEVIDKLVEISTIDFPPVMVEQEIERIISAQERELQANRLSLEEYLKSQQKSRDDLREDIRPVASKQVAASLALSKLAEAEQITVSEEDIDKELEKMVQDAGEHGEELKRMFQSPQARMSMQQMLLTSKTIKLLTDIASGEVAAPAVTVETSPVAAEAEAKETESEPSDDGSPAAQAEERSEGAEPT